MASAPKSVFDELEGLSTSVSMIGGDNSTAQEPTAASSSTDNNVQSLQFQSQISINSHEEALKDLNRQIVYLQQQVKK